MTPDAPGRPAFLNDAAVGSVVRHAFILTALWTVPVIIGTAGHFFGMAVEGKGMPAWHIFGHSFAMWYAWIPATPLIFALHRALPMDGKGWRRAVLAHLTLATLVFLFQSWAIMVTGRMTGHLPATRSVLMRLTDLVVNQYLFDLLTYAGVLAVAIGLDYARRYRDRDLRASQLQAQLASARLDALRAQLQPHFLFNALNSVAMLIRRERKQEALDVVVGFGELLRYVLEESGTKDVPLSDEIRFLERYLQIEQVRHRERLIVELRVTPEAERALVPNLILQPLVENALRHAVGTSNTSITVRINATRTESRLRLEVEDDGPGLPAGFSIEESAGVGLRNTRDRLREIFGADSTFSLGPGATRGVLAIIEFPYREEARPAMVRAG
ncbi:MAG: histidine kinase [Gemmatimonadaceae bacterium]